MLRNLSYVPCLKIVLMEKAWFRPQWNIPLWFIAYMEKAWFCRRLFFEVAIVTVKIKKYIVNDTI